MNLPSRARLSVVLITKNEAARIERCLASVHFADECVVLDSGSSDGTVALARKLGARVIETDWPGFGPQKNRALDAAQHDWVFSIDADEWVDETLAQSIIEVLNNPAALSAYRVRRLNRYRDQAIYHGNFGRDHPLRLFRKSVARFTNLPVHESVECAVPTALLEGWLHHDTIKTFEEGLRKSTSYARLSAIKLANEGKGGTFRGVVSGVFAFFREYVLRLGVLDGWRGLELAWLTGRNTVLKYHWAGQRLKDAAR